jgi:tetratricopeptide (TPR) repeat protein
MSFSPLSRFGLCIATALAAALPVRATTPQTSESEETIAFQHARAITRPEERIAALSAFTVQYPSGTHSRNALEALLRTYLDSYPDRTQAIHTSAEALIAKASPGLERWIEESRVADLLASGEPQGADLAGAQSWAQAALDALSEGSYRRETTAAQLRYKLPKLSPKQTHEQFIGYRASFLTSAAHVALDQQKYDRATELLAEAYRLNPLSGEGNALRGQLALAQNQPQPALDALERADAMGALTPALRGKELQLFQQLEHGDAEDLNRHIDEIYRALYPPLYTLSARQLPAGGHTTLLELFTGSGCMPCAGPDLAIESLLTTYTRQDLAVLEYDEHIPRPDPLTTPDALNRGAFYDVSATPEAYLDGQPVQVLGAARADVENIVIGFADAIESEAALPSGLQLSAKALTCDDVDLCLQVTMTPLPLAPAKADETTGDTSATALARARVFVALAQDHLRYSGENGIRFHRMVVRAVQQAPASRVLGPEQRPTFRFQPAAIQQANSSYLREFETANDRFGAFHFATTDFPLKSEDLSFVVWVQDSATRQVLQTIVLPASAH